jgi:L-alanine-DL-glutamate epimerase-like enolase superfamily enzyme
MFRISRGSRTTAEVVVAEIAAEGHVGRGECVPYPRYGETVDGVMAAIASMTVAIAAGFGRRELQHAMHAGAARNALDAAFWDLEAKRAGVSAASLAGLGTLAPLTTAYTLSLDTPGRMAEAAVAASHRPLLKLKLGGAGDLERVAAVHAAAPQARLIVDANEGWTEHDYRRLTPRLAQLGVELIEQPLPEAADAVLAGLPHPIPICADESCHTHADLDRIVGRYDAINIKLDKTGGLTEALVLADAAAARGFKIMVGCMIGTSLAMAPAVLVAQKAGFVDLDGPLLLARDREPGLRYEGGTLYPPDPALWG